jgi:hypothetical protein
MKVGPFEDLRHEYKMHFMLLMLETTHEEVYAYFAVCSTEEFKYIMLSKILNPTFQRVAVFSADYLEALYELSLIGLKRKLDEVTGNTPI